MKFRWVTAREEHSCSAAFTHGPHPIPVGARYVRVTIFRSLLHESGIGTVKFCAAAGAERPDIPDDPLIAAPEETT